LYLVPRALLLGAGLVDAGKALESFVEFDHDPLVAFFCARDLVCRACSSATRRFASA